MQWAQLHPQESFATQVSGIAVNVNQIAKRSNTFGVFDQEALNIQMSDIANLRQSIVDKLDDINSIVDQLSTDAEDWEKKLQVKEKIPNGNS